MLIKLTADECQSTKYLLEVLVDGDVAIVVLISLIIGALLDRFNVPPLPEGESTSIAVTGFIDIRKDRF